MKRVNRREFIKLSGKTIGGLTVGGYLLDSFLFSPQSVYATTRSNIFAAKNGTPAENVAKVFDMRFGGIENFIDYDDVVVINPNGQWICQGASNCACIMGLIDLILNRPGGFDGEIIFCENTQGATGYWTATGSGLDRNGPYNYNDMIAYYQGKGHANVSGIRMKCSKDDSVNWPVISGVEEGQGWIRPEWQSPTDGCLFYLPYPIILSPYSGRLIDLRMGVYDGGYEGQPALKYIKVPTLNNHGWSSQQDYAGVTSATKSFLGISEIENGVGGYFDDGNHANLHAYSTYGCGGNAAARAYRTGEAIGAWMATVRRPDLFLTTAEWVGWESRTGSGATNARTVGLAEDPVSLDYYMSKYVLWPTSPTQEYFNPDFNVEDNMTRQTLNGCSSLGFGTLSEAEMAVFLYDFNAPSTFRFDIDRMILKFKEGEATQQDVLDLIDLYNSGN